MHLFLPSPYQRASSLEPEPEVAIRRSAPVLGAQRVLSVVVFLGLGCGGPQIQPSPIVAQQAAIDWQAYSSEVFEQAAAEGKLVLLDVGIEGCTACRWMLEDTYQNPEVIRRVRAHFIAVSVDAGARPEIGERYLAWAWPATIVLSPEGQQLLAIRGNKRPRNFIPILDRLIAGESEPLQVAIDRTNVSPVLISPTEGCEAVHRRIETVVASVGWGRSPMHGIQASLAIPAFEHESTRSHALRTAEEYTALMDPEWGGVFVGSYGGHVIPEKRLRGQVGAMLVFAHAYALTRDRIWLEQIAAVDRYITDFLSAENGLFFASQRDAAPGLPDGMSAADYFRLPDIERRQYGVPLVDRGTYSALNALAIEAYARVAHLTAEPRYGVRAIAAAEVLSERLDSGVLAQMPSSQGAQQGAEQRADQPNDMGDGALRGDEARSSTSGPVLETQVRFGLALLALYDLEQDIQYKNTAVTVSEATLALAAPNGGFFSSLPAGPLAPHQSARINALAARFWLGLLDRTHELEFETPALSALGFADRTVNDASLATLGELAQAHGAQTGGLIEVSVVGVRDAAGSIALLEAGNAGYAPSRSVHFDTEGRYPDQGQPSAFVCTRSSCSQPLFEPDALRTQITAATEVPVCSMP